MSLLAPLLELAAARAARRLGAAPCLPTAPRIFVLRNNDLGDVLVITPLFEALKSRFPESHLAVGSGRWARPLLEGNPYVDEILQVDAPWFNKYTRNGAIPAFRYLGGRQARALEAQRYDLGIDVLGSTWGSLLLVNAGIPHRLGRTGFAGGDQSCTGVIPHSMSESVGRNALRFAELLGATSLPSSRPQLFLSTTELECGRAFWDQLALARRNRWIVSPGAGRLDKAWPESHFSALTRGLADLPDADVVVVCGPREADLAMRLIQSEPRARMANPTCTVRELASIVASADGVVCNSSLVLHLAAAFDKPTVTVLGRSFTSAREHQVVWGHANSVSLGAEPGGPEGVASVNLVLARFVDMANRSAAG